MNKKILVLFLMLLVASSSIVSAMNTFSMDAKKEDIVLDEKNSWDESNKPRNLDELVFSKEN